MASISYLPLDTQNDVVFTAMALTSTAAVAQAIYTRLNLFYGEWWESLTSGLPVFQKMLGQPATALIARMAENYVTSTVLGTPYVTGVASVAAGIADGQLSYTLQVTTAFGPVTASNVPALSASLGA